MWIEGMPAFLRVESCRLEKAAGQHSCLTFTALVKDGDDASYLSYVKKPIKLFLSKGLDGREDLIFSGLVRSVQVNRAFASTRISVRAASTSVLLDEKKHARIFQAEDKTMNDVLSRLELTKEVSQVKLEAADSIKNAKYEKVIVQNRETNFSFLKRCSEALAVPLWVRDAQEQLRLKLDNLAAVAPVNHLEDKDILTWQVTAEGQQMHIRTQLKRYIELGRKLPTEMGDYVVTALCAAYENGRDVFTYRLQKYTEYRLPEGGPDFVWEMPLRLLAKVTNNRDDKHMGRIQVHFTGNQPEYKDLDEKKARWLPYRSPYTGKKNGLVFLPDKDDQVEVTLLHGGSYAVSAYRYAALDEEGQNPDEKYLGNNFTRRIRWREKSLELWSGKTKIILDDEKIDLVIGKTQLRLDQEGLHLKTGQEQTQLNLTDKVSLTTKGDVLIDNQGTLALQHSKNMQLDSKGKIEAKASGDVNLESSRNVNIKGSKIKMG